MKRLPTLLSLIAACLWLAGCSNLLVRYEPRGYVVQPGDTLYTIAWRHGVDHRSLAAWNGLTNPDLIYVGQQLVVAPPSAASGQTATTAGSRVPPAPPASTSPADRPPAWQWPTRGPVLSSFGAIGALSSGVGIGGRQGQPVNAAAAGRVVYAGGGLIGYGQLVIIKHNETYLSAYGHNGRLLVAQGDDVRQGQAIAEMGLGPGREPRLHFEIRRNGTPIDPLPFLRAAG